METKIINNLAAVLNALNSVTVSGKHNLSCLSGSISVLEETMQMLGQCEIAEKQGK